jgi:hypothetical protein
MQQPTTTLKKMIPNCLYQRSKKLKPKHDLIHEIRQKLAASSITEHRNRALTNPESPASLREHNRLDALITHEYEDLSTLNTRDRRWFCHPKEVLFTEPIEYKQQ